MSPSTCAEDCSLTLTARIDPRTPPRTSIVSADTMPRPGASSVITTCLPWTLPRTSPSTCSLFLEMMVMRSPRMVRSVPMTEVPLSAFAAGSKGDGPDRGAGAPPFVRARGCLGRFASFVGLSDLELNMGTPPMHDAVQLMQNLGTDENPARFQRTF